MEEILTSWLLSQITFGNTAKVVVAIVILAVLYFAWRGLNPRTPQKYTRCQPARRSTSERRDRW